MFSPDQQGWKIWSRIVARAWINEEFKQYLVQNTAEVLKSEGIEIPSDLDVRVKPVEEVRLKSGDESQEQPKFIQLVIPLGVPIKLPVDLEVKVEAEIKQTNTELPSNKYEISIEIPGVEIIVNQEAKPDDKLTLILPLPPRPSETDLSRQAIEQRAFGIVRSLEDSDWACIIIGDQKER